MNTRLNPLVDRLHPQQTVVVWHPPEAPDYTVCATLDVPNVCARDFARELRRLARQLDRLDREDLA